MPPRLGERYLGRIDRLVRHSVTARYPFQCVLFRGHQGTFNHSCGSCKPYAKPLPGGHYTFEVFGVNRAGFDPKPATKSFAARLRLRARAPPYIDDVTGPDR